MSRASSSVIVYDSVPHSNDAKLNGSFSQRNRAAVASLSAMSHIFLVLVPF